MLLRPHGRGELPVLEKHPVVVDKLNKKEAIKPPIPSTDNSNGWDPNKMFKTNTERLNTSFEDVLVLF